MSTRDHLASLIGPVARELLGEPNKGLSSKKELRWGARGSLAVDLEKGVWHDHETNTGGGTLDLIARETGRKGRARFDWLEEHGYQLPDDDDRRTNGAGHRDAKLGPIVATYDYVDEAGAFLFQVTRHDPKDFRQRMRDAAGQWTWKVRGVRQVPYRLLELIEAIANEHVVAVAEGERDVDNLRKLGIPATTNAGGAGKWRDALDQHFAGADVVIIADNDPQKKHPKTKEPMFHDDGRPILPGQDHAQDVARHLSGVAARVRVLDLGKAWPACPPKGDISDWIAAGGTIEQLFALVERLPDWSPEAAPGAELGEWDAGDDPGPIPPRQWLLGNQFCRGFISSIVAAGGTGKTALRLVQFLSLALGRSLCGQHVFKRCRVLLVSLEDDTYELQRRIKAALDHFGIARAELRGWLFCAAPRGVKLAELRNKTRVAGPLAQQLRAAIALRKPDLVSLDPFVKTHALEENDSGDMDFVCDVLAGLAVECNIAVDSPHHVHKGTVTPGDADSGRGSSGIRDAGRLVYTLAPMSEAEADGFNIDPNDRHSYVRLDPAKINIAVRGAKAEWFHIVGQPIGNATTEYPSGDTIQVAEPWSPPNAWTGTTVHGLNAILDAIDRGLVDGDGNPTGQRYSNAPSAGDRAAWPVVQKIYPDKSEGQCREIIHTWLATGLLYPKDYLDPVQRKSRSGLHVAHAKRPT
jgi:AAA domain